MKKSKHSAECHGWRSQVKSFHPHKGRVWSEGGSFWTAIFNNDIQLSVTLFPCVLYRFHFQCLSICRFVKGNLCRKSAHCLVLSTLTSINFYPLVCSGLFSWTLAVIFVFLFLYFSLAIFMLAILMHAIFKHEEVR